MIASLLLKSTKRKIMSQDELLDWFFSSDYSKHTRKASSLTCECRGEDDNKVRVRLLLSYSLLIAVIGVPDTNTVLVNFNEGYSRTTDRHIWSVIRRAPDKFKLIKFPFYSSCPFSRDTFDITNLNFIGNPDYIRSYICKHDLFSLRHKYDRDRAIQEMENLYYSVLPFLKEKYPVNAGFYELCMCKIGDYFTKAKDPVFIRMIQAMARGKLPMEAKIKTYWNDL